MRSCRIILKDNKQLCNPQIRRIYALIVRIEVGVRQFLLPNSSRDVKFSYELAVYLLSVIFNYTSRGDIHGNLTQQQRNRIEAIVFTSE